MARTGRIAAAVAALAVLLSGAAHAAPPQVVDATGDAPGGLDIESVLFERVRVAGKDSLRLTMRLADAPVPLGVYAVSWRSRDCGVETAAFWYYGPAAGNVAARWEDCTAGRYTEYDGVDAKVVGATVAITFALQGRVLPGAVLERPWAQTGIDAGLCGCTAYAGAILGATAWVDDAPPGRSFRV